MPSPCFRHAYYTSYPPALYRLTTVPCFLTISIGEFSPKNLGSALERAASVVDGGRDVGTISIEAEGRLGRLAGGVLPDGAARGTAGGVGLGARDDVVGVGGEAVARAQGAAVLELESREAGAVPGVDDDARAGSDSAAPGDGDGGDGGLLEVALGEGLAGEGSDGKEDG